MTRRSHTTANVTPRDATATVVEPTELPISAIREAVERRLEAGRIVISAPTASGKSTQVPRWCAVRGRVLVVEPRRVACRGLAARVAELEHARLGAEVGYSVRDDHRATGKTRILFATPGVVLRMLGRGALPEFETVILDEFHERGLETDLILALLLSRRKEGGLVVMSATLDADRVANRIDGVHVRGEGRQYPISVRYFPTDSVLPTDRFLADRVVSALAAARDSGGDVLVFLPGKAEIAQALSVLKSSHDFEVFALHGGLSLEQQSRVFTRGDRRRIILSTNVAETSITVPGIGIVIDSGLERRTEYHNGRGFLTLVPIAMDSAEQRAGRAGRVAEGACFRLWSRDARLGDRRPPEIHRGSLVPLVLAAAACGVGDVSSLPFCDPPKPYAVEAAGEELRALGALDQRGRITERGRRLFGLPLDPVLAAILVTGQGRAGFEDILDLASVLAVDRPLFKGGPPDPRSTHDLRESGCDAVACIRALREGDPRKHRLDAYALAEARAVNHRLRRAFGAADRPPATCHVNRRALAATILEAFPRGAHVARRRKRQVAWSNGGTEMALDRNSAVNLVRPDAIIVLASRAVGVGRRERRLFVTCAMPVPLSWMVEAGLGRDRVAGARVEEGRVVARVERVHARRVLAARDEVPEGELAREAVVKLFLEGSLFEETRQEAEERLAAWTLATRVGAFVGGTLSTLPQGQPTVSADPGGDAFPWPGEVPDLETWVRDRLEELGLDSGSDLALLSPGDFLPPELPQHLRRLVDRAFPRQISLGDARYDVAYDLDTRVVTLNKVQGLRKVLPDLRFLPPFPGFRIQVQDRGRVVVIRGPK